MAAPFSVEELEDIFKNPEYKKRRIGGCVDFVIAEAAVDDEYYLEDDDIYTDEEIENHLEDNAPSADNVVLAKDDQAGTSDIGQAREKATSDYMEFLIKQYGASDDISIKMRQRLASVDDISIETNMKYKVADEIDQLMLLPTTDGPNLWIVKCRVGEEKSTVLHLMRKFLTYQNINDPLKIASAVAPSGAKGYIYVEAYKPTYVKAAIINVRNLRLGQLEMVPIKELTDVLKVIKRQTGLKQKQFVRLSRGKYKDDIAQVRYVDETKNQVQLKLWPRIDYTRVRAAIKKAPLITDGKKPRLKHRPTAKPFDPVAIQYGCPY